LLEYDSDLVYRPGRLNCTPDALSRNPLTSIKSLFLLTAPDLHQAQQIDSLCTKIPAKILQGGPILLLLYTVIRTHLQQNSLTSIILQPERFSLLHQHPASGHLGLQRSSTLTPPLFVSQ
jgi:hypothetical protein